MVWYPSNALLDGIDPWSEYSIDRMRYLVYTRRLCVEAMKTKALLLAALNNPEAGKAATAYMEMAVPYDKAEARASEARKEASAQAFAESDPIPLSSIRLGGLAGAAAAAGGQAFTPADNPDQAPARSKKSWAQHSSMARH